MKNSTPFQLVLLGVFGVLAVIGVAFFALNGVDTQQSKSVGPVTIWGTLDPGAFKNEIGARAETDPRFGTVNYVQKDEQTFDTDLTNAIASGTGPDLIVIASDDLVHLATKLSFISYDLLPQQTFEATFIQEGNLFLATSGIAGVPLVVDPMVMFWNRDLLTSAGYVAPPKAWGELIPLAGAITKKNESGDIVTSVAALGEYQNVAHAKEILSMLMMQAGSDVVHYNANDKLVSDLLAASPTGGEPPAQSALRFYTEFADPTSGAYSWNRSFPDSRTAFASGDVALYFGFASEVGDVVLRNPNLNFGVAEVPQIPSTNRKLTFGRMYAFAIPRGSANPDGARTVAFLLAGETIGESLASRLGMPSANISVLSKIAASSTDMTTAIVRSSAIISRGWLDPEPDESGATFKRMVERVTSGAVRYPEALKDADSALSNIIRSQTQ